MKLQIGMHALEKHLSHSVFILTEKKRFTLKNDVLIAAASIMESDHAIDTR